MIGGMDRTAAHRELEAIYAELQAELDALRPLCRRSDRCCRFGEFGHQLWTTPMELDYLIDHEGPPTSVPDSVCPYLRDGLCGVHDHRMLGCRVYFCDPNYSSLMGPVYEKYHARIKELHRRHGIPYRYFEVLGELRRRSAPHPEPR